MADSERKRPREESEDDSPAEKRPCSTSSSSFQSILSLLESEEESPAEDVSSLISSLQEEICSADAAALAAPAKQALSEAGGDEVIRHLLEASDLELGIPAEDEEERREAEESGAVGEISNYDVFWELEEEAANYYALFQSPESFMA